MFLAKIIFALLAALALAATWQTLKLAAVKEDQTPASTPLAAILISAALGVVVTSYLLYAAFTV